MDLEHQQSVADRRRLLKQYRAVQQSLRTRRRKTVWQSGMACRSKTRRHDLEYVQQRKDVRVWQLSRSAQYPGRVVIREGWSQHQIRFSEFLGAVQPDGICE